MKQIIFGDIHGRTIWKDIINYEKEYDEVIFLGDYMDPYEKISLKDQLTNFAKILMLPNNVLLLGNHDYHYLSSVKERYSRFNEDMYDKIHFIFDYLVESNNIKLIYIQDNFIFSHAGISKEWLNNRSTQNLEGLININNIDLNTLKFVGFDGYGYDPNSSPIWIRIQSLCAHMIDGYKQVVGHTRIEKASIICKDLYLLDSLENGYYAILEDGELMIKKYKNEEQNT